MSDQWIAEVMNLPRDIRHDVWARAVVEGKVTPNRVREAENEIAPPVKPVANRDWLCIATSGRPTPEQRKRARAEKREAKRVAKRERKAILATLRNNWDQLEDGPPTLLHPEDAVPMDLPIISQKTGETIFTPFVPESGDVVAEVAGFTEFRGESVRFETKYYKP